jgi:hypothetical protein
MAAWKRSLRPAQMPRGTPTAVQKITAESTMANVVMVSSHSPSRPMRTMVIREKIASLIPENFQATRPMTIITIQGGRAFRPASKLLRVFSTGHLSDGLFHIYRSGLADIGLVQRPVRGAAFDGFLERRR